MTPHRRPELWLAVTALAYVVCHHVGSLPDGLGGAGHGTRVADWIDLVTPVLVLSPALMTLVAAGASRRVHATFAVGSWVYASGHGVHLSANSIGNVAPGATAHFWDEDAGHAIWFTGAAVVAGCLVVALRDRPLPRSVPAVTLAVLVGLTWASNALGGHFWVGGLVGLAVAAGYGWRHHGLPQLLLVAAVPGAFLLSIGLSG